MDKIEEDRKRRNKIDVLFINNKNSFVSFVLEEWDSSEFFLREKELFE